MVKEPVFILGSHKSGTSLLRSLLDGCGNLFAIPIEMHFFEHMGFWVDYAIRRSLPADQDFDSVLARIKSAVRKSNEKPGPAVQYGGDSLPGTAQWGVERLLSHLEKKGRRAFYEKDYRVLFDAYLEAAYLSLKGQLPPQDTRFVEKSVENAEFAPYLKKLYPEAKFIHIVRNPYAALVSIRKFKSLTGQFPYIGTFLDALQNSYYHAFQNPLIVSDYLLIRYEDLVLDAEKVMKKVANHLEMPFEPSMLIPSTLGEVWKGNSMSGLAFDGISSHPLEAWKQNIYPLEIVLVNLLLPHVLRKFGYELMQPSSSPFLPMKGERLKKYLANRLYWFFAKAKPGGEMSIQ